jgi:hypothetical protein
MMKRREKRGLGFCALAVYTLVFMPLAGIMHGITCHGDGYCGHQAEKCSLATDQSEFDIAAHKSLAHYPCRSENGKKQHEHDNSTCPVCQVLLQFATSVVIDATSPSLPSANFVLIRSKPSLFVAAVTPYTTPFSRAPPVV